MYSIKHHASKVTVHDFNDGWMRADYLGPLSAKAFAYLGALVCRNHAGAVGVIEHLDRAVTLFGCDDFHLEDLNHLKGAPSGVWVVNAGQYMDMLDLSQRVRHIGVTRYVALPHQLAQAVDFVRFESTQSVS